MKQKRGCSRLYAAPIIIDENGAVTFGTPFHVAPVKAISIEVPAEGEAVYGDNHKLYDNYAATEPTRTFEVTGIELDIEAKLLGNTEITVGERKLYGTAPDASLRPEFAFGYALHDGDKDNPVEIVWAHFGKVESISKSSNTIDNSTGSEGQTITVKFRAPEKAYTKTGKREPDFYMPVNGAADAELVNKWFTQVVTADNAEEVLA